MQQTEKLQNKLHDTFEIYTLILESMNAIQPPPPGMWKPDAQAFVISKL